MEYQKIINLLDNASNQPLNFRTKNLIAINDDTSGTSSTNTEIKFKTAMLKSNLCYDIKEKDSNYRNKSRRSCKTSRWKKQTSDIQKLYTIH